MLSRRRVEEDERSQCALTFAKSTRRPKIRSIAADCGLFNPAVAGDHFEFGDGVNVRWAVRTEIATRTSIVQSNAAP
jgi:hypothetical protein